MSVLSCWGKEHPWKSRFIITVAHFLLAGITLWWGSLLAENALLNLGSAKTLGIFLFLLSVVFYPLKSVIFLRLKYSYRRQKLMDLSLILCSCLMLLGTGWEVSVPEPVSSPSPSGWVVPIVHKTGVEISPKAERQEKRSVRKAVRKQLRETLRQVKGSKGIPKGIQIALSVLLALSLVFLLLGLSCSIACSGAEGLAILVFVSGLGLIVFGLILLLRNIQRKANRDKSPVGAPDS